MCELPWADAAVLSVRPEYDSATVQTVIMRGTLQAVAKKAGLLPKSQREYLLVALPSREGGWPVFAGTTLETLISRERAGWRARRW
jgi:hypothetical protein